MVHNNSEYVYMYITIAGFYFLWSNIVAYFTDGVMFHLTHVFEAHGEQQNQADRKWFAGFCMIMLPVYIVECLYYAGVFD